VPPRRVGLVETTRRSRLRYQCPHMPSNGICPLGHVNGHRCTERRAGAIDNYELITLPQHQKKSSIHGHKRPTTRHLTFGIHRLRSNDANRTPCSCSMRSSKKQRYTLIPLVMVFTHVQQGRVQPLGLQVLAKGGVLTNVTLVHCSFEAKVFVHPDYRVILGQGCKFTQPPSTVLQKQDLKTMVPIHVSQHA
jgi:hypothetical protein